MLTFGELVKVARIELKLVLDEGPVVAKQLFDA
jgi:hypothetical protein